MWKRGLLVIRLNKALAQHKRGQHGDAWRTLSPAIEELATLPPSKQTLLDYGRALQLAAEIHDQLGDLELSLQFYLNAETVLRQYSPTSRALGECLHDFSLQCNRANLNDLALEKARESLTVMRSSGASDLHDLEFMIRRLERWHDDFGVDNVEGALAAWRSAENPRMRALAADELLGLVGGAGAMLDDGSISAALRDIFDWTHSIRELTSQPAAVIIDLFVAGAQLPDWIGVELQRRIDALRGEAVLADGAILRSALAASFAKRNPAEAMRVAIEAVAISDVAMLQHASSDFRSLLSLTADNSRLIALELAVDEGHHGIVAELIESARLQVVPRGITRDTGDVGLSGIHPVSVAGSSELEPAIPTEMRGPSVRLEDVVASIGGDSATWWGAWLAGGKITWAVIAPNESDSGTINAREGTVEGELFLRATNESFVNPEASIRDALDGAWSRDPETEREIATELGGCIIPEILRRMLMSAGPEDPMSLVLAGNLFSYLPIPALVIGDQDGRRVRLVERAVIRVSPPAALSIYSKPSKVATTPVRPVLISCLDPRGDLRFARTGPRWSRRKFGTGDERDLKPATIGNVVPALKDGIRGAPGVFFYSGHGVHGGIAGDADDGLDLADGVLTARAIFAAEAEGDSFAFPDVAVLSACELTGALGSGAGEWIGLSAAIIAGGARHVVAAHWRILDSQFTSNFELELVARISRGDDPAVALRAMQVAYLGDWESMTRRDVVLSDRVPYVLIWGAFCVTSVG